MGCNRERTTSRKGMGRFQIRFQTIMESVNSVENERCGFEIGLVFESVFKQVEIGLDTGKQRQSHS